MQTLLLLLTHETHLLILNGEWIKCRYHMTRFRSNEMLNVLLCYTNSGEAPLSSSSMNLIDANSFLLSLSEKLEFWLDCKGFSSSLWISSSLCCKKKGEYYKMLKLWLPCNHCAAFQYNVLCSNKMHFCWPPCGYYINITIMLKLDYSLYA